MKYIIQKGILNIFYCSQHKSLSTSSLKAASKYSTFNNAMKALQKSGLDTSLWIIKEVKIPSKKTA